MRIPEKSRKIWWEFEPQLKMRLNAISLQLKERQNFFRDQDEGCGYLS
jgi:hypothetical protein